MNAVLITGGDAPDYKYVKELFCNAYVCVADSGLDWALNNSVKFNSVVGDMDSVKNMGYLNSLDKNRVIKYPKDKDDTDTVIGLKYLKREGYKDIVLIGGGGGRLDHLLGIFSLLTTDLAPKIWYTHKEIIYKVKGLFPLKSFVGYNISIYPLSKVYCSIKSNGLKWNLNSVDWTYKSIGISNCVVDYDSWIDTGSCDFIVIVPLVGKKFD